MRCNEYIIEDTIEGAKEKLEEQYTPFSFQDTTIGEQELTYLVMKMNKKAYNGRNLYRTIVIAKSDGPVEGQDTNQYVANVCSCYDFDNDEVIGDGGRVIQYKREKDFVRELHGIGVVLWAGGKHKKLFKKEGG